KWLTNHLANNAHAEEIADFFGLDLSLPIEVHTARIAYRVSPDGDVKTQLVLGLLQHRNISALSETPQDLMGSNGDPNAGPTMRFEGGSTLIADLRASKILYVIRKSMKSDTRVDRQRKFSLEAMSSLRAVYWGDRQTGEERLAALHRGI